MAGHPNNSFRGLWAKEEFIVPGAKGVMFETYSESSNLLTANSTGLVVAGGVKVNNKLHVRANSTGFSFGAVAAKPSARTAGYNWSFLTNSTGVSAVMLRTTGTTWKYLNVTSVLPT